MKRLLSVAAAVALAAGCTSAVASRDAGSSTPPPSRGPAASSGPSIRWAAPGAGVALGAGWSVGDCEGDAPLLCVRQGAAVRGLLELLGYPVASTPDLRRDLARGERAALGGHADRFLDSVRDDRAVGCPGLRVEALPTSYVATADGATLVRYGFTATTADGRPAERMVQYAGIRDAHLVLLTASAIDDGGCLSREGSEFTTATLTSFEPTLDALVRRSAAPDAPVAR